MADCDDVVAIHGCKVDGEVALLGGRDNELAAKLGVAMSKEGLECHLDGHMFPGTHPKNICNRGRRRAGVQLELSAAFRESAQHKQKLVAAVREVLLQRVVRRKQLGAAKPLV